MVGKGKDLGWDEGCEKGRRETAHPKQTERVQEIVRKTSSQGRGDFQKKLAKAPVFVEKTLPKLPPKVLKEKLEMFLKSLGEGEREGKREQSHGKKEGIFMLVLKCRGGARVRKTPKKKNLNGTCL